MAFDALIYQIIRVLKVKIDKRVGMILQLFFSSSLLVFYFWMQLKFILERCRGVIKRRPGFCSKSEQSNLFRFDLEIQVVNTKTTIFLQNSSLNCPDEAVNANWKPPLIKIHLHWNIMKTMISNKDQGGICHRIWKKNRIRNGIQDGHRSTTSQISWITSKSQRNAWLGVDGWMCIEAWLGSCELENLTRLGLVVSWGTWLG